MRRRVFIIGAAALSAWTPSVFGQAKKPLPLVGVFTPGTGTTAMQGHHRIQRRARVARPEGGRPGRDRRGPCGQPLRSFAADLIGKHSELMVDAIPGIQCIGYLLDSNLSKRSRSAFAESARRATIRLNVQPVIAEAGRAAELEAAFAQFRKSAAQGIVVLPSTYLLAETPRIMQVALSYRLPAVHNRQEAAEAGALFSYGHDAPYNGKRAAWYVDRILRGTKPGASNNPPSSSSP